MSDGPKKNRNDFDGGGVSCTVAELFNEALKVRGKTIRFTKASSASKTGLKRSRIKGRGMEFFESRPYVMQDEIRNIDWKVYARLGELFTKIFIEEKDRPVYLVLDFRPNMFFGSTNCFKSVLASRVAAQLAMAALNGGDRIASFIFTPDQVLASPLNQSRRHLAHIFSQMAQLSQNVSQSHDHENFWPRSIDRITKRVSQGALVFFLSDFWGLDHEAMISLSRLRKKADICFLNIRDPLEEGIAASGTLGLEYDDRKILFDTSDESLSHKYSSWWQKNQQDLQSISRKLAITTLDLSTASDPKPALMKLFGGRLR